LQHALVLTHQDNDDEKVTKLERALALYNMQESLPLFTALLSLPTPAQYSPLNLTPQKQKERTLQALLQLLVTQAERQETVSVWEDLHWADPSSLEFLSLLIEQIATTKLLLVLTFRPEFTPPWKPRSHISQLVLNRLGRKQVEAIIDKIAATRDLSAEVIEQIRVKTDGVPLFVEELTKSVIESAGGLRIRTGGTLAIPATLQEALLARLDRLSTARQVAQLGAALGREFSQELLQAVSPLSEADLQAALEKLVEVEILYRRGMGEQARYFFKHALIQDTAYQLLLKSARQQYHRQIARVLAERFPHTQETEPELLAHHYTEANLIERAIPYWQKAGEMASERSASIEAISHLTKGLALLQMLPDTAARARHELTLQMALGVPLMATRGYAAPDVERAYARARALCQQLGDTPQTFPVLWGLAQFYLVRAEYGTARGLGEQLLRLAHGRQDPALLLEAHRLLGGMLHLMGELTSAQAHLEQGMGLYDRQQHRSHAFLYGHDPAVVCLSIVAMTLWHLGYPDQALYRVHEALALAQELDHPFSLAWALTYAAVLHQYRREGRLAQQWAEAAIAICEEQEFALWLAAGTYLRGWALAEQGQGEEGLAQMRQGISAYRGTGAELSLCSQLGFLAETYEKVGQVEKGLSVLAEALTLVNRTGERHYKAELCRLKGKLLLQSQVERPKSKVDEAEACFHKAIEIARRQQAKSLELRAVMSLARLWQQQGKKAEAHSLLAEIYDWFTEGFDTKDLQEAKALLKELA
jgi:predicted ATPase